MDFIFLSEDFYSEYRKCNEIQKKETRPYIRVVIKLNNITFGVPLRSNITHEHVLWTNKADKCGVDFSKAVVILDEEKFINHTMIPHIRENEFKAIKGKEYEIQKKLLKYINDYKKAKQRLDIARNKMLCEYSCLQYFEEYICDIKDT